MIGIKVCVLTGVLASGEASFRAAHAAPCCCVVTARNAVLYTNNQGLGFLFFCDLSVFSGLFSLSRISTLLTL